MLGVVAILGGLFARERKFILRGALDVPWIEDLNRRQPKVGQRAVSLVIGPISESLSAVFCGKFRMTQPNPAWASGQRSVKRPAPKLGISTTKAKNCEQGQPHTYGSG